MKDKGQSPPPDGQPPPVPTTPLVALVSWESGFCLAHGHYTPRYFAYELRCHSQARSSPRWAVHCSLRKGSPDAPGEPQWRLWLPVRTEAAALMMLAEIQEHLPAARQPKTGSTPSPALPSLAESQLRFLAKTYPRTVALMRVPHEQVSKNPAQHRQELFRAYVEETFALTGVVVAPPQGCDELLRMARLHAQASARKRKPDPVEAELIIGCYSKGYRCMALPQLQAAIHQVTGSRLDIDALRQKWKRLGLPSQRTKGRPKQPPGK